MRTFLLLALASSLSSRVCAIDDYSSNGDGFTTVPAGCGVCTPIAASQACVDTTVPHWGRRQATTCMALGSFAFIQANADADGCTGATSSVFCISPACTPALWTANGCISDASPAFYANLIDCSNTVNGVLLPAIVDDAAGNVIRGCRNYVNGTGNAVSGDGVYIEGAMNTVSNNSNAASGGPNGDVLTAVLGDASGASYAVLILGSHNVVSNNSGSSSINLFNASANRVVGNSEFNGIALRGGADGTVVNNSIIDNVADYIVASDRVYNKR